MTNEKNYSNSQELETDPDSALISYPFDSYITLYQSQKLTKELAMASNLSTLPTNQLEHLFLHYLGTGHKNPALIYEGLRITRAKDDSRNPRHFYISHHKTRTYMAKVTPGGTIIPVAHGVVGCTIESLHATLVPLFDNPIEATIKAGHKSGNCCFCGTELSNGRSIERGYGPICAENWGLPL